MTDKEMRCILIEYLAINNREFRIFQEKNIGSSICDLMLVTDRLCGFEIKSDSDNFERIGRQVAAYEQFFDENTLVVGGRYLHTAQEKVPESWGILCIERHGILKVRAAAKNKKVSVKAQLVFLFIVEVETEHLRRLQSAPSAAEPSASPAEAAVVGVVGAAESHQPQLVGKPHCHEPCGIAVFSSVREVGVRQQSFVHALLYSEVEHGLFLAVVDARHPGEVALLVVRFHLLYYRGRQVFQSGLGVSHHKLLAVYENLLYLLAVDCYVSVVVNLGSRQSFYQLFDHRPLGSPVGCSVVNKRVFACGHLQGAAGHGSPLQHY